MFKEAEAREAIESVARTAVDGKKIEVKLSRNQPKGPPPTKLFVGNLPDGYERKKLEELFQVILIVCFRTCPQTHLCRFIAHIYNLNRGRL